MVLCKLNTLQKKNRFFILLTNSIVAFYVILDIRETHIFNTVSWLEKMYTCLQSQYFHFLVP